MSAVAVSETQVDLSWTASTDNVGVVTYELSRCEGASCHSAVYWSVSASSTSITDPNPVYSTNVYHYKVRAYDAAGNRSSYSTLASVTIPGTGFIAAYSFDEGSGTLLPDDSGNSNTGTLINAPTWVSGQHVSALQFDASDDNDFTNDPHVDLGTSFDVTALPFTVSAWVNPVDYADERTILSKYDGPGASQMRFDFGIKEATGHLQLQTGTGNNTFGYLVPLNTWTHITIVAELTYTRLYINGVEEMGLGVLTLGSDSQASTTIGARSDGTNPFKGQIDDLRVYNRALSPAQVVADMNNGVVPTTPPNTPPTVSITAPADGAVFGAPANITINADATDSDGSITQVEFYEGGNLIGTDTTAPYSVAWTNVAAGSYSLTAKATDDDGSSNFSTPVSITVNALPTVSITTPSDGATFTAPASIDLAATAVDTDGSITQVQFYEGANLIATDTTAPYAFTWTNVAAGSYSLTAVATDNLGATTTSAIVGVTVGSAPAAVQTYYIHADHLNSPRVITDVNQVVVWRWDNSDPFGATIASEDPDGNGATVTCNLRFPGQYFDQETNNHYNYYRDYNPETGRYVQSDPIGLQGGLNTYGYVASAPIKLVDPHGLETAVIVGSPTKGNPFGHIAIAFTGQGVYSFGTATPLGSNLTNYLAQQASYRESEVLILNTTPAQEQLMIAALLEMKDVPLPSPKDDPLGAASDTCAVRTGAALTAGGIRSTYWNPNFNLSSPYPSNIAFIVGLQAVRTHQVLQGGTVPSTFSSFNPSTTPLFWP